MYWKLVSPAIHQLIDLKESDSESQSLTLVNSGSDMILSFESKENGSSFVATIELFALSLPKLEKIGINLYKIKINQFEMMIETNNKLNLTDILEHLADQIIGELNDELNITIYSNGDAVVLLPSTKKEYQNTILVLYKLGLIDETHLDHLEKNKLAETQDLSLDHYLKGIFDNPEKHMSMLKIILSNYFSNKYNHKELVNLLTNLMNNNVRIRKAFLEVQGIFVIDNYLSLFDKTDPAYHVIRTLKHCFTNSVSEKLLYPENFKVEEYIKLLLSKPDQHPKFLHEAINMCCSNQLDDKVLQQSLLCLFREDAWVQNEYFIKERLFKNKRYFNLLDASRPEDTILLAFKDQDPSLLEQICKEEFSVYHFCQDMETYVKQFLLDVKKYGRLLTVVDKLAREDRFPNKFVQAKILQLLHEHLLFLDLRGFNEYRSSFQQDNVEFLLPVIKSPHLFSNVFEFINRLDSLQIFDEGRSEDNWSKLSDAVIRNTSLHGFATTNKSIVVDFMLNWQNNHSIAAASDFQKDIIDQGWKFFRLQGRTILFKHQNEEKLLALKIQKTNEDVNELHKQNNTVNFLKTNKTELSLQSEYPEAQGVKKMSGIVDFLNELVAQSLLSSDEVNQFLDSIQGKNAAEHFLYQYKADKDYFIYLHDKILTDAEFFKTALIAMNDYLALLEQGFVYDRLADIFHNQQVDASQREDRGRYLTLVNLMRPYMSGGGRLNAFKKAVEFINIRKNTGIADEGDWNPITLFINATAELAQYYFSETHNSFSDAPKRIIANFVADYFLILELVVCLRVCQIIESSSTKLDDAAIKNLWLTNAKHLHDIYIHGLAKISHLPLDVMKRLFDQANDVQLAAEQMQYWISSFYINDIKNNTVPAYLYPNTQVRVNFSNIRAGTFNDRVGFSINGVDPDIGTVNGQYSLKQGECARHDLISFGFKGRDFVVRCKQKVKDGNQYQQKGDLHKARACYEEAIHLNPYSKIPYLRLVQVNKQIAKLTGNDTEFDKYKKIACAAFFSRSGRERKCVKEMSERFNKNTANKKL